MKLNVATQSASPSTETIVLLCASPKSKDGDKKSKKVSQPVLLTSKAPVSAKETLATIPLDRFKGEEGDLIFLRQKSGPHLAYVGVGDVKKLTAESLRKLSAPILQMLKGEKIKTAQIYASGISADVAVVGFTEGLLLSNYQFTTFKEAPKNKHSVEKVEIAVEKSSSSLTKTLEQSQVLAESINFARWLGDCPGNFMTPTQLGQEAEKMAKGTKLKVVVWDKKRIEKEKMGSFLGVSLGSSQEPRFITMEYRGGPSSQKPICYVGKGLTFDSGGISLKPGGGMEEMKFDMCGGANVIATMGAIAKMGLKINAIAYVPTSENMPGPAANKPGDICTARNGKTIEVNNTDAEGRLILADALVYACEQKPAMILDTATLTGAMMIALGNTHTGYFTRNDALSKKVDAAAENAGERVWRMPLVDDHVKDMKGTYADLTNLAPSRNAGSSTATAFLESFVDKEIPWAHFDIAGTGWNVAGRLPYLTGKGASGAIVRTFVEMAKNFKG
jgi:leucyl aminopeptidase